MAHLYKKTSKEIEMIQSMQASYATGLHKLLC